MSLIATSKPAVGAGQTLESGPYVLKSLLEDVPLCADGDRDDIVINCVQFWDTNLYIGTSAAEILHFVQIPPDPSDPDDKPTYILASRLAPNYVESSNPERPGVQQILLLPAANKACILCNSTVTFYSLPELSPVLSNKTVTGVNWIGGLDLDRAEDDYHFDGTVRPVMVLLSLRKKIRSVEVGEGARAVKTIDFTGCINTVRRGPYACVSDSHSYALLHVEQLLKIPLFPVSSLDESQAGTVGGQAEDISSHSHVTNRAQRSTSTSHPSLSAPEDRSHTRSTSLGNFISKHRQSSREGRETPDPLFRESSPAPTTSSETADKPSPQTGATAESGTKRASALLTTPPVLKPHILSPSSQQFLLVTGTTPTDPSIGIFVNLEGDVTRSTLEFSRYPQAIVADGRGVGVDLTPVNAEEEEEGYVLAVIETDDENGIRHGLEVQRWDIDQGEEHSEKYWLPLNTPEAARSNVGIMSVADLGHVTFDEVVQRLCLSRFRAYPLKSSSRSSTVSEHNTDPRTAASLERVSQEKELFESQDLPGEQDRAEEELQFARRLGKAQSRIISWSGNKLYWTVRNPLALRLDAQLDDQDGETAIDLINSLRGREARTEIEFVSLDYVRQRAGLLLLTRLMLQESAPTNEEYRQVEEAVFDGTLDPRVIIALNPQLRAEVLEGREGIWISTGIRQVAEEFISKNTSATQQENSAWASQPHILQFYRRFLLAWRKRKGFGSTVSDPEAFQTVDAALLVVLLTLDRDSKKGFGKTGSVRAELNDVVDNGVECFDRAVQLLESYHRLYILSRLYQSRKSARDVLATWKRMVEGERDDGGEFVDGELRVRDYLTKIKDAELYAEYSVWLAQRNPKLAVQVFTDDRSRVKLQPKQVVTCLREHAPNAVKEYLEYLVFGKGMTTYANELIAYYLDIVIEKLESSQEAKDILQVGYESYRALSTPKPTYQQFIQENAVDEEWWQSRLRLLQLLGGSQDATAQYDIGAILRRIEPFTEQLVPEVIILAGREGHHDKAIKLLVHGLGDYSTVLSYCLAGGSSIYHPVSGALRKQSTPQWDEQVKLFHTLLAEFLKIEDEDDRLEQTGNLLERFGAWFDVSYVLSVIPDSWSIEAISKFLVSSLRRLVSEHSQAMVVRALSGGENIKVAEDFVDRMDDLGPTIEVEN